MCCNCEIHTGPLWDECSSKIVQILDCEAERFPIFADTHRDIADIECHGAEPAMRNASGPPGELQYRRPAADNPVEPRLTSGSWRRPSATFPVQGRSPMPRMLSIACATSISIVKVSVWKRVPSNTNTNLVQPAACILLKHAITLSFPAG